MLLAVQTKTSNWKPCCTYTFVGECNVTHFKGLIMLYLDFEVQGRGSTFTFCHAHTANILVAEIATISCVTCPVAIWMQYLQPSTAASLSCYICNFKLQTLQLHKLLIQKLFAPISCNLEEKRTITSLGFEPMTFHTKPWRSTEWAIWNDENKCGKWCTNANFPLNLQLLGAASNRCNICI